MFNTKIIEIENEITNILGLVIKSMLNVKITEVEKKKKRI